MINIQEIIPYMKDGWVAMDEEGKWYWYEEKPVFDKELQQWIPVYGISEMLNVTFDIAPADECTKSLIQVKGVKR